MLVVIVVVVAVFYSFALRLFAFFSRLLLRWKYAEKVEVILSKLYH